MVKLLIVVLLMMQLKLKLIRSLDAARDDRMEARQHCLRVNDRRALINAALQEVVDVRLHVRPLR
jgi:hypothetical protein